MVASRVGDDQLGRDIHAVLVNAGIEDEFLQFDSSQPTGTVRVQLDSAGQPKFEITQPVAWDFLEWSEAWRQLASSADAICFGTLAQRSPKSRNTIRTFLNAARAHAIRIFDVNLRQSFYSAEIIRESLECATVVKMNHEEVPRIKEFVAMRDSSDVAFCRNLIERFNLKLACITLGANGSVLCDRNNVHEHSGFRVSVKDTIGAGDAFTAGLVHAMLRGESFPDTSERANRLGAWVAAHSGGMPQPSSGNVEEELKQVG